MSDFFCEVSLFISVTISHEGTARKNEVSLHKDPQNKWQKNEGKNLINCAVGKAISISHGIISEFQ